MNELNIAVMAVILLGGGGVGWFALQQQIVILKRDISDKDRWHDAIQQQNDTKIRYLQNQLDDLQTKYLALWGENLRLSRLDTWRQNQMIKAGLDLPPIPDALKPSVEWGDINVFVNRGGTGGVNMTGGNMSSSKDIVGGDTKDNK